MIIFQPVIQINASLVLFLVYSHLKAHKRMSIFLSNLIYRGGVDGANY